MTLVRVYPDGANPHMSWSKVDFYFFPEALESDFAKGVAAQRGISVQDLLAERVQGFAAIIELVQFKTGAGFEQERLGALGIGESERLRRLLSR